MCDGHKYKQSHISEMKSVKAGGTVVGQIQAPKVQLSSKSHFEIF